jgi:molybdate-binding protein/DNA-binding transcriptional regulator YhcF (GntR family)
MMQKTSLYQQIAESLRSEIIQGRLKPGDHLPTVRQMTERWGCTPGTVQRAYQELVLEGLLTTRPGQGTRVCSDVLPHGEDIPLRRAGLVNRTEAFLLEVLNQGYAISEVEQAFTLAFDRWRSAPQIPVPVQANTLTFYGSHDLAVDWIAAHFEEVAPGRRLELNFTGSLGGLIALAEGKAQLAGSHLWDEESDTYNSAYIRRLLPGKRVAMVTLAHRRLGLIVPAGNPMRLNGLEDLSRPEVIFVNRQPGSGTRVWLDANLRKLGILPEAIHGFDLEKRTHAEVAQVIAEGKANAGMGLDSAALAYGLTFVFLRRERYDLIIPAEQMLQPPMAALLSWLKSPLARGAISSLGGYDTDHTGEVAWVNG